MSSDPSLELILGDSTNILVRVAVCLPPIGSRSKYLMSCKKHFLMIIVLGNLQLLFYQLQPVFNFHQILGLRESGRASP
jgi:hypothetical protein